MPSPFSVLRLALGGKRKGRAPAQANAVTTAPGAAPAPMAAPPMQGYQAAVYPATPARSGPIYAPPFTLGQPGAPTATPAMPAASPAISPAGLIAGGMPLTTPAAFRAVLGVSDLRWIGLQPTLDEPEISVEEGNGVSATWTSESAAQGGIELGLFSAAKGDPAAVLQTIIKGGDGTPKEAQIADADEAFEAATDDYAWLAARRGPLVFALSIPSSPRASQQLGYLGGLILHRVSAG